MADRDLTKAGIAIQRRDNCVCEGDGLPAAQKFLQQQLTADWPSLLKELTRRVHPIHEQMFANCPAEIREYYFDAEKFFRRPTSASSPDTN